VSGAGTTFFNVSNTGAGDMPWTAQVVSGDTWLSIESGSNGSGAGTIKCAFDANTSTSVRTGKIRVTAAGATGSPQEVTVKQAGQDNPTISGNVKTSSSVVAGATITFSGGGGETKTDSSGNYSVIVPYSYSGTAVPSKTGYTFNPASRTYSNLTASKTGEDYIATDQGRNPIVGSNSIEDIDVVKITDMSGLLPDSGGAVTVKAWDKTGKELLTAGSALPITIKNHGTTSIPGADIESRLPDGPPAAYPFLVESSKMFITNVNNSFDMAVKVPIIFTNGLSNFASNSIGSRNTIKVTDMSGTIATSGSAITVSAWDAAGKSIPESASAVPLKLYNHGTTTILGSSLPARFPTGSPMTYEFIIASPKLIVSNVKNSVDGTLNIPTVYTVGVSEFVSNSIGPRNTIWISDFSGALAIGGAAINVRAWDASGKEVPESDIGSYKIYNFETVKITGAELASRFSSGSPTAYEFTVDSPNVVITNVKSSTDGSINIPTVYTKGVTKYTTNYVTDFNTIQITDMSGGI
ncbi:MAG: BACON domain-containing protein, partial [Burkholderiaceae bacterium]|nr:BACON domain-containing protein [Burkholderiaceae bacterium]